MSKTMIEKNSCLSSLAHDLGISQRTLYLISNSVSKHYREVEIPKAGGGTRTLSVPDCYLKQIQKRISEVLLPLVRISPYACAYRKGGSTVMNAAPHVGAPVVLKLDIHKFFDSIIYPQVKENVFPKTIYSEPLRVLLTILCTYRDSLPQGSPASPGISNVIMCDFDNTVGAWCAQRGVAYTRYCDDMTFSGEFDPEDVKSFVNGELRKMGFFLNDKKTSVVRNGRRKQVCGIVVNEKISVPKEYRRKIRQEVFFCKKYGVSEHLKRTGTDIDPIGFLRGLAGRISYVRNVYSSRKGNDKEYFDLLSGYLKWISEEIALMKKALD